MADILQIKGDPVRVLVNVGADMISTTAVDCRRYNAVSVTVFTFGTPSATISLEGSDAEGGNYLPLVDPNASQAITANESFDAIVGPSWVKVRISSYSSGTFIVIVTPYVAPGQSTISITAVANQNLSQYGGVAVGSSNPVDVEPIATAVVLGKVRLVTAAGDEATNDTADAVKAILSANSGVDIGDVDVASEPSGSGQYTTPTHTAPTVGVATGEVLASNASRLYALLVNDSDTVIYIKLGAAAVLNQGIRLGPNGGYYEMSKKAGNLYTGAINGISSAASKTLLVTEGV